MTLVLTVTCARDADLLACSQGSLRHFAEDYDSHLIFCDRADFPLIKERVGHEPLVSVLVTEDEFPEAARLVPGQLRQRYVKLAAAARLPGPCLSLDSDMLLMRKTRLTTLRNTWVMASGAAMNRSQRLRNRPFTVTTRQLLGFGRPEFISLMEGLGWWLRPDLVRALMQGIEAYTLKPPHEAFADVWSRGSQPSEYVLYGTWLLNRAPEAYTFWDLASHGTHPLTDALFHHQSRIPGEKAHAWAAGLSVEPPRNRQLGWLR